MKKRIVKIISAAAVFAMLVTILSSCSIGKMSFNEYKDLYSKAVADTFDEDLYYWKETINKGKEKAFNTCNVYAEMDKKYQPIRNENGEYANQVIVIVENSNNKESFKVSAGKSKSSKKGGGSKDMLFTSMLNSGTDDYTKTVKEMSPHEYYNSDQFQGKYSPKVKLSELSYLTADDMNFDAKGCGITKKGVTTLAKFEIKSDYFEKFKSEFGKDSLFAGSVRVAIETAYEKISSIIVYSKDDLGNGMSVEVENYKFEIVYFGPIAYTPSYDETMVNEAGKTVPVWTEV